MAQSIPQPHVRHDMPLTLWRLGPLPRETVARFVAELERRVPRVTLRPMVVAQLAGETATLYLTDPACSAQTILTLHEYGARAVPPDDHGVATPPAELHLVTWPAVRAWATLPTPGATGAAAAAAEVARVERAVREAGGVCTVCGQPIVDPAPGRAGYTLDRACWKAKIAAGRQRQIAADMKILEAA